MNLNNSAWKIVLTYNKVTQLNISQYICYDFPYSTEQINAFAKHSSQTITTMLEDYTYIGIW